MYYVLYINTVNKIFINTNCFDFTTVQGKKKIY